MEFDLCIGGTPEQEWAPEGTMARMCLLKKIHIYYTVSYFYGSSEPDNPLA